MRAIERGDLVRLARYLAFACLLYLLSHVGADLIRGQFRPATWLLLDASNVESIAISLIVAGLAWVNTLNESSSR